MEQETKPGTIVILNEGRDILDVLTDNAGGEP